jgi:hypothetical protein
MKGLSPAQPGAVFVVNHCEVSMLALSTNRISLVRVCIDPRSVYRTTPQALLGNHGTNGGGYACKPFQWKELLLLQPHENEGLSRNTRMPYLLTVMVHL